jgi:hypothetical protein
MYNTNTTQVYDARSGARLVSANFTMQFIAVSSMNTTVTPASLEISVSIMCYT